MITVWTQKLLSLVRGKKGEEQKLIKIKFSLCKVYYKLVLNAFLNLSGLYLLGHKSQGGES